MSIYPSPDKLDKFESKYALVILAAKRARQIKDGAPKLVASKSPNPLTVALEEIAAGMIIPRIVEDLSASAHQKALKPNVPSLEDIVGAGPVIPIEIAGSGSAAQIAALRNADPDADEEDDILAADEEDLRPIDEFALDAPGMLLEDDDDLQASLDDDDED